MEKDGRKKLTSTSSDASTSSAVLGEAGTSAETSKEKVVYATEEQIVSVFSNEVISDVILSYLNFGDMKAVRQVSRRFHEMIERYKRFKNAQVLCISEDKSPLSDHDFLLDPDRIYRGIKIDVALPLKDRFSIQRHVLENAEFVSITAGLYCESVRTVCIGNLLVRTSKISHLQLDHRLLERDLNGRLFSKDVEKNLKNLRRLDITDKYNRTGNVGKTYEAHCSHRHSEVTNFALNLNLFLFGTTLEHLESFRMPKLKCDAFEQCQDPNVVLELIQKNRKSLRELSIHFHVWESKYIVAVSLPRLASLTVTINVEGQESLKLFLATNHQSLDELDVGVKKQFEMNLLDVIKKCCSNVTKLHLKAKRFVADDEEEDESRVDWTFLGDLKRLKDFALSRPHDKNANWEKYGNGTRILESLPRNQLERLSLRGIGARKIGFWKVNSLDDEPELSFKLNLLNGFRNLKRLSLWLCPDAVDDGVMQFIVKEMTSLEEFEVSQCSQLTDAGFAGSSEDGSDSIRNLKGLKELAIRACPLVSPDGLLSYLKLQFLRYFLFWAENSIPESFILGIMSQNPSLEVLGVNGYTQGRSVLENVKKHPRMIKLINLRGSDEDPDSDADATSDYDDYDYYRADNSRDDFDDFTGYES